MSGKMGVMLCGHGSRDPQAIAEFGAVAAKLRARLTAYEVEWGFLEFARPIIREGLDKLRARGCDEIQGYLISRPVSAVDLVSLFDRNLLPEASGG